VQRLLQIDARVANGAHDDVGAYADLARTSPIGYFISTYPSV